jgi:hypothetical protein
MLRKGQGNDSARRQGDGGMALPMKLSDGDRGFVQGIDNLRVHVIICAATSAATNSRLPRVRYRDPLHRLPPAQSSGCLCMANW